MLKSEGSPDPGIPATRVGVAPPTCGEVIA